MARTVLIAGASGIIGRYALTRFANRDDWRVVALSRRPQTEEETVEALPLDLLSPSIGETEKACLAKVTHVLYSGYSKAGGNSWSEQTSVNARMFENLVDLLEAHSPKLERIVLMQGQKYYGSHLGPFKTPTKEDDPRHAGENFYFNQQDLLAARSEGKAWDFSCLRPHIVCGFAERSPMNAVTLMAVYAAIMKAKGQPLFFPGKPSAYKTLYQASDAGLLASSIEWAMTEPRCQDQAYNIVNGDFFRWEQIWPSVAEVFEMPLEAPRHISLAETMAGEADLWNRLTAEQGLRETAFEDLVDWSFGDYIFSCDWDIMASTIKARQHGFADCRDSEEMFVSLLTQLRREKVVP